MAPMTRMLATLIALASALSLAACASDPDKQWYKPSGNYTSAEFERDTQGVHEERQAGRRVPRAARLGAALR